MFKDESPVEPHFLKFLGLGGMTANEFETAGLKLMRMVKSVRGCWAAMSRIMRLTEE